MSLIASSTTPGAASIERALDGAVAAPLGAALIRTWKPWQRATGPRTPDGKATASRNAYKGGHWLMLRELSRMVNAEVKSAPLKEQR